MSDVARLHLSPETDRRRRVLRIASGCVDCNPGSSSEGPDLSARDSFRARFAAMLGRSELSARGLGDDGRLCERRAVQQPFFNGTSRTSRNRGAGLAASVGQRDGIVTVSAGHRHAALLIPSRRFVVAAAGIVAALPGIAAAQPQFSPFCGVTGYATAPTTITYDPFSPGGLSEAIIPLVLQRNRGVLTGRTDEVSLVLVAPAGTPPLQITYQGQTVLYPEGATAGRPRGLDSRDNGAGSAGEIRFKFGGLFASDLSAPLNLRVSVPPGTDLSAGESIQFDILYVCSGDGGMLSVPRPVRESGAIRLDVNTVSALQAYYAGSVLDFGEVGDLTTAQLQASPDRYTTPSTNSLRVRSSGPYEVRVRSQNDFRLTFPGGNTGNTAETIRYSVRFMGQDIASNGAFGTRTCARAGVAGGSGVLPIRAKLAEGGSGKAPSASYGDTVTITFTPLVAASAAQQCAGL